MYCSSNQLILSYHNYVAIIVHKKSEKVKKKSKKYTYRKKALKYCKKDLYIYFQNITIKRTRYDNRS